MKAFRIFLVIAFVIFSGFSRESQNGRYKEGVVVPMKVSCVILPDAAGGILPCTPNVPGVSLHNSGFLQGNQTHGGNLITEQSTWQILSCSNEFVTGGVINTAEIVGENTVANGDTYTYSCIMYTYIPAGRVILNITITDGTGRFEGATGYCVLTGVHTGSGIPCSGEGYITFLR